ncbi:hypothetical protein ACSI5F_03845 [Ralstonia pseudosolanacearum]|uniref:hypothetical protein n=1 Tax=Ralstonia pseudosolanacearum TaxID=1310165 RepID=UPI003EDE9C8D
MSAIEQCELCRQRAGRLDFNRPCCRVRFLLKLPQVGMRREWLAYWRKRDGDAIATLIETEVKARWAERNRA